MIKLEFDTDNAAFEGDDFQRECQTILRDLADKIGNGRTGEIPLFDSNGNKVGTAHVIHD